MLKLYLGSLLTLSPVMIHGGLNQTLLSANNQEGVKLSPKKVFLIMFPSCKVNQVISFLHEGNIRRERVKVISTLKTTTFKRNQLQIALLALIIKNCRRSTCKDCFNCCLFIYKSNRETKGKVLFLM